MIYKDLYFESEEVGTVVLRIKRIPFSWFSKNQMKLYFRPNLGNKKSWHFMKLQTPEQLEEFVSAEDPFAAMAILRNYGGKLVASIGK